MKISFPSSGAPLAEARETALIADLSKGDSKALVVAFDLADSNWPLRISFPLFISNALRWLPEQKLRLTEVNLKTGEALPLFPTKEALEATVTTPSGKRHSVKLQTGNPSFFSDTKEAGIYKVKWGAEAQGAPEAAGAPEEQVAAFNLESSGMHSILSTYFL